MKFRNVINNALVSNFKFIVFIHGGSIIKSNHPKTRFIYLLWKGRTEGDGREGEREERSGEGERERRKWKGTL